MGQCLSIGEIIDCHEFQVFPVKTCPKDISANSTKSINPDPDCHIAPSFFEITVTIYLFSIPSVNIFSSPKKCPIFPKREKPGILGLPGRMEG
jgi:hypothetical protein